MRVALGASRGRLVRKALVESVTLGVVGGVLGVAVAYAGTRLIVHLAFGIASADNYVPIECDAVGAGAAVHAGRLGGDGRRLRDRAGVDDLARGADRGAARRRAERRARRRSGRSKSLVIAQAAMSLVLLSAAALLGQSLRNLEHQDYGFEMKGRYVAWINPKLANYKPEQLDNLFREILDKVGGDSRSAESGAAACMRR